LFLTGARSPHARFGLECAVRNLADFPTCDAGQQVGDELIEDATEGRFQPNEDALKNLNLKLRMITGTDPKLEAKLVDQKQSLLTQQDRLFDEAVKNGVPTETVDATKSDFKKAQASYDITTKLICARRVQGQT